MAAKLTVGDTVARNWQVGKKAPRQGIVAGIPAGSGKGARIQVVWEGSEFISHPLLSDVVLVRKGDGS